MKTSRAPSARRAVRPVAAALAAFCALPAGAHIVGGGTPHFHAGDIWGVLVVIALTAAAAWIDRRGR